jgi:hypothetical protein
MIDSKSVAKVKVEKKSYAMRCVKDGKAFEIFALAVPSLKLEKISERRNQECYVCGYYLVSCSPQSMKEYLLRCAQESGAGCNN